MPNKFVSSSTYNLTLLIGQLISKGLFGFFNSFKKQIKNFQVCYLQELKAPKFPFEINWPLSTVKNRLEDGPNFCGLLRIPEL